MANDAKNRKIRVLLTVPHLTSSASPFREMMALAKYLPKDKFELTICSLRKNGVEETGPLLDALGVPYFFARYRVKDVSKLPDFFNANRLIKQYGPFDIQHSFDFTTLPLEALIAKMYGRKFIHQQRNLNQGGHRLMLLLRILLSIKVIACSPNIKVFLTEAGIKKTKIVVIALGLDGSPDILQSTEIKRVFRDENPSLLMVSNIVPLKRIQDAIAAVRILWTNNPGIQLRIVGAEFDAAYKASLDKLIVTNQLQKNIFFLGSLGNTDVLEEMRKSDIFIHCAEHEAFGWVLLEAFSQRLPVIAANAEGPSDIIRDGENGFLYPVGDVNALTGKILTLLENPELRQKLTENALADVKQKYSAQQMVREIAAVYEEVMTRDTM